jgi:drug/metabolite transporter (DMT)-like permease
MPLADAVALSFTKVFFVALLAVPLLGERLTAAKSTATGLGFLGVILVVQPSGTFYQWQGPVFAIASAVCFAFSMITVRKLSETESAPLIVLYYTATAALVSGLSLFWHFEVPTLSALGLFVLLGTVGGSGQLLMTTAFARAPASIVSPFSYSAIIWAALFGYLIWGELIGLVSASGIAVIMLSGIWLARQESV